MAGLVLDVVLAYLFKSARRMLLFFESSKWERTTAVVTRRTVLSPGWGCSSVKVFYEFAVDGVSRGAWDEIPFYMDWHARTYAESMTPGLKPIIRVNPKDPRETRFFEQDQ
jgi:hypothetical protein